MDIARYIGLFLLKNKFAYIHGLGNLELVRMPATYDGQNLNAPQYDVHLTPGGSIDDTLANFIATHEQTSISKAANALREFSIAARADLAAGKEVLIPALGKFVEGNRGVEFISDPALDYTPPPIPALRTAKRVDDEPTFKTTAPAEEDNDYTGSVGSVAWGKIVIWVLIIAAICAAGYFGYRYINSNNKETADKPAAMDTAKTQPAPPVVPPPAPVDTTKHTDTTHANATAQPAAATTGPLRFVINTYPTKAAAEKRVKKLTGIGKQVELLEKDANTFMVVMPWNGPMSDTTHMKDSLTRILNPKGVTIYR